MSDKVNFVRIKSADGSTVGNGVFLDCGLVLTCEHVIRDAGAGALVEFFWLKNKPAIEISKADSCERLDIALLSLGEAEKSSLPIGCPLEVRKTVRNLELDITAYMAHAGCSKTISAEGRDEATSERFWIAATDDFTQWVEGGVSGAAVRPKNECSVLGIVIAKEKDSGVREALVVSARSIKEFMVSKGIFEDAASDDVSDEDAPLNVDFSDFICPEGFREEFECGLIKLIASRIVCIQLDVSREALTEACNHSVASNASGELWAKALLANRHEAMKVLRVAQREMQLGQSAEDEEVIRELLFLLAAAEMSDEELRHIAWGRIKPTIHHGTPAVGTTTRAELLAACIDEKLPCFLPKKGNTLPEGKYCIPLPPENGPDSKHEEFLKGLADYYLEGDASGLMVSIAHHIDDIEEISGDLQLDDDLISEINAWLESERDYGESLRSRYVTLFSGNDLEESRKARCIDLANAILEAFPPMHVIMVDQKRRQEDLKSLSILRQVVPTSESF